MCKPLAGKGIVVSCCRFFYYYFTSKSLAQFAEKAHFSIYSTKQIIFAFGSYTSIGTNWHFCTLLRVELFKEIDFETWKATKRTSLVHALGAPWRKERQIFNAVKNKNSVEMWKTKDTLRTHLASPEPKNKSSELRVLPAFSFATFIEQCARLERDELWLLSAGK